MNGKVALVTGSGGEGIGAATARELASRGAHVIINYRNNQEKAQTIVDAIHAEGGEAQAIQADIVQEDQVQQMINQIIDKYGRLDIMVSTKGGHVMQREHRGGPPPFLKEKFRAASPRGEESLMAGDHPFTNFLRGGTRPFVDTDWNSFFSRVQGELQAAFLLTKAVVPVMEKQSYGRLVYLSSEHSRGPAAPGMIANGVAKAALNTFVVYLAHELGPLGITANIVSPAVVEVRATRWMQPKEFINRVAEATPLGRIAQPEDIARAIAFFAGDDSAFMTGVYAPVNGGLGLSRL